MGDRATFHPALVLKVEATELRFICWVINAHDLRRCRLNPDDPLEVGSWITLKINECGVVEHYSDLLEVFECMTDERFIQIECTAQAPPEEYARANNKKGMVYNPELGWAYAVDKDKRSALKRQGGATLTAMFCCALQDDHFEQLVSVKKTVWYLSDFRQNNDVNDVKMPWSTTEQGFQAPTNTATDTASANKNPLLYAPYVCVTTDNNGPEPERDAPSEPAEAPATDVTTASECEIPTEASEAEMIGPISDPVVLEMIQYVGEEFGERYGRIVERMYAKYGHLKNQ